MQTGNVIYPTSIDFASFRWELCSVLGALIELRVVVGVRVAVACTAAPGCGGGVVFYYGLCVSRLRRRLFCRRIFGVGLGGNRCGVGRSSLGGGLLGGGLLSGGIGGAEGF